MARNERTKLHPVSEVAITLDEIHLLIERLDDYEEHNPARAAFHAQLSERLLSLWSYWARRTNDTTGFTLRIQR